MAGSNWGTPSFLEMDEIDWQVDAVDLGHEQLGECRQEECQILIASRLNQQKREQTLCHELIHMFWNARELGDKEYGEEEMATHLGAAMYTFLKKNCNLTWKEHCGATID